MSDAGPRTYVDAYGETWNRMTTHWNGTVFHTWKNARTGEWIIPREVVNQAGLGMLKRLKEAKGVMENDGS